MRKLTVPRDSQEINFEWTDSSTVMITTKTKIGNSRLKKQICMHIASNWEIRIIGFSRNGLIFAFFVESHLADVFCWLGIHLFGRWFSETWIFRNEILLPDDFRLKSKYDWIILNFAIESFLNVMHSITPERFVHTVLFFYFCITKQSM